MPPFHFPLSGIRALCICWLAAIAVSLLAGCAAPKLPPTTYTVSTEQADLPAGDVRFDLYRPAAQSSPAPLVVVAHGLWRDRTHMAGWGRMLASAGFVVAVPDMPTLSDYPRNGRFVNELVNALCDGSIDPLCKVDSNRIGLVGLSAGGLATLLAAADNPKVKVWVGLDPVDRGGLGIAAAPRVHAHTFIVRAPASIWNSDGNAVVLRDALPGCSDTLVPDAIHIDPEWPSDWTMELMIGMPSEQRREEFAGRAAAALRMELGASGPAFTRVE